ncbi:hypothetical protein L1987_22959 [Smallanthus sonchifolius]|uniref:Uncharacterized protein n=1 Tax=Smallanthus sonchifolius TaxID=185202 RepID=A0ACB9IFK9_9ASTR|nr:hypothetical protein L1987_22959 [Smallanthus sonchifolius]
MAASLVVASMTEAESGRAAGGAQRRIPADRRVAASAPPHLIDLDVLSPVDRCAHLLSVELVIAFAGLEKGRRVVAARFVFPAPKTRVPAEYDFPAVFAFPARSRCEMVVSDR